MKVLVDSNVVLRFLISEEESRGQHNQARKFWQEAKQGRIKAVISLGVVQEVLWVATDFYQMERADCVDDLITLFESSEAKFLEVAKKNLIAMLLEFKQSKLDFIDIYLGYLSKHNNFLVASFDQNLTKMEALLYQWPK